MANAEAWNHGWALGSGIAQEQRAHKQALSDQEFQEKAALHAQELQCNLEKLASTTDPRIPKSTRIRRMLYARISQILENYSTLKFSGSHRSFRPYRH